MSKHFDCISIGSATVDVVLKSDTFKVVKNDSFKTGLAICEMYGSKTELTDFVVSSGGGATNSSCSLSNLGLSTSCVSIIGDDDFSDLIYDDLARFNVDIDNLIVKKGEKTAFSTVLTAPDGGRTALVYRGPCSEISVKDIKNQSFNTSWVYLTNLGGKFANTSEVIKFLNIKDIRVFWNPGSKELEKADISFFKNIEILSLNSEEASILSGIDMENIKELVKFLKNRVPAKIRILTVGKRGAFCITNESVFHISSLKVKVENTIGAGDAFGSGFLYGVIKDLSIEESLEYAIKNSVSVIQKTGAKEGFLSNLEDLRKPKIKRL